MRFGCTLLSVSDMGRSLRFYTEVLGLEVENDFGANVTLSGRIALQTENAIKNISEILLAAGSSLDRVVKTTCFLADIADFASFNEVYGRYFTGKPARSLIEAAALPKGSLVEIEAIAETENK